MSPDSWHTDRFQRDLCVRFDWRRPGFLFSGGRLVVLDYRLLLLLLLVAVPTVSSFFLNELFLPFEIMLA